MPDLYQYEHTGDDIGIDGLCSQCNGAPLSHLVKVDVPLYRPAPTPFNRTQEEWMVVKRGFLVRVNGADNA